MEQKSLIVKSKKLVPYVAGLGVVSILFMLLTKFMTGAVLLALCIIIPFITGTFNLRASGVELATLTTIVFGMAFGPVVGGIIGGITVIFELFLGKYINTYIIWVIPSYILLGIVAGAIGGTNIAATGLALLVALYVVLFGLTLLITPAALPKFLPYAGMNILINYFLITKLGPALLNLMI